SRKARGHGVTNVCSSERPYPRIHLWGRMSILILDWLSVWRINEVIKPPQPSMNTHPITRRQFVKRTAIVAGALSFPSVASRNVLGANERLNIAGIGVGGKGAGDISNVDYENICALCDVDEARGGESFNRYPKAKRFK